MEEGRKVSVQASDELAQVAILAGNTVTVDEIYAALTAAGVTHGIKQEAIEGIVEQCAIGDTCSTVVAELIEPVAASGHLLCAQVGEIVAPGDSLVEFAEGEPGYTVKGELIAAPAEAGRSLSAGDNTLVDGNVIRAGIYGKVEHKGFSVQVTPMVTVAPDRLSAQMTIAAFSSCETPITDTNILDSLSVAGVCEGIQREAIRDALDIASSSHEPVVDILVAEGCPAQAGEPAAYEFLFPVSESKKSAEMPALCLVQDEQVLCQETPEVNAVKGFTVLGEVLEAPRNKTAEHAKPICGANVSYLKEGHAFVVNIKKYGYAQCVDGKISVTPMAHAAGDKMSANIILHPPAKGHLEPNLEIIKEQLNISGITFGIDEEKINTALSELNKDPKPMNILVAEGKEKRNGRDAYLKAAVSLEQQVGETRDDGSIDYRERGSLVNLINGAEIGTVIPAEPGQPQVDIFGGTTPAQAGRDIAYQCGEGVEFRDGAFFAVADGALQVKNHIVFVTDVYAVQGDVNLSVGNLHNEKGSIDISGCVESGFEVKAKAHIAVRQSVENSTLLAGGDISIGGGYTQGEDDPSYLMSMGTVNTRFALNAHVYSYQNIDIADSSMNSRLEAKGSILAIKGKGCIIGGTAKAGREIRVKNLGSDAGAVTLAEIQLDPKTVKGVKAAIEAEEQEGNSEQRIHELHRELRELQEDCRENGAIIVEGTLYPGVTVKILDVSHKVVEERHRCRISLGQDRKLKFHPLR